MGTLITSGVALLLGVPVAIATAIYITELAPRRIRTPVTILVELLAAVPSVVYGLWGIFVLAPNLQGPEQWFADTFSFIPFVGGGTVTIPNLFVAGLVLAIMILPIVSAISREVMATVPADQKEAMLGLGATRWEMIRMAVLPYCRSGITSGAMLGLGRAIGETIAVTILVGDSPIVPQAPVRAGLQPRRGDRQRVRRGAGTAPLRAVRRRPGAVRPDAARQRARAPDRSALVARHPDHGSAAEPPPRDAAEIAVGA